MLELFIFALIMSLIIAAYPPSAFYVFLFVFAVVTYFALRDEPWSIRIGSAFFLFLAIGAWLT